jgi:integrase
VWIKPSAHTKQKKDHRIPLSPPARALLSRLREEAAEDAVYVFPGDALDDDGEPKPLRDIKHAWLSICRAAGLAVGTPEVDAKGAPLLDKEGAPVMTWKATARLHDLRHTYASHLVSSGLSLPLIGQLLGHTQAATTQRYAHLADDPLREATTRFGAMVTAAHTGQTADIVTIPKPSKGVA